MRTPKIAPDEYYHIFNRGNNKQAIFLDDEDRIRFLFLILHLQSPEYFPKISRHITYFCKHRVFDIDNDLLNSILKNRYVELVNFALMPNHFHLTVFEKKEGGTAQYMQRSLNSYTKYFNTKHQKSGHLFQGPFKAVHIGNNEQLLYLSAYIHRNPNEISEWRNKSHLFPWSSCQDYVKYNRWGNLINTEILQSQFSNATEYKIFMETSGAKEISKKLDDDLLIDFA